MAALRVALVRVASLAFLLFYVYTTASCSRILQTDDTPSDAFHSFQQFTPYMLHDRTKREMRTKTNAGHANELSLVVEAFGKEYIVDLQLNRELFPANHFEKYHFQGKLVTKRPFDRNITHCYYKGRLRGILDSWAAISTCDGVGGVIYDGHDLHYIQPIPHNGSRSKHYIYRHSDVKANNWTCGYENSKRHKPINSIFPPRLRRSLDDIQPPYNSNRNSRYVELVLVNDNRLYKEMKSDVAAVIARSKEIANIANALYAPLNIFIALVGVVVWSEFDEITLSQDGDTTLTNFLHYRRERLVQEHPNDNAQLVTGIAFNGGVVGKALKGPICTYEYSGGVNMDHNPVVGLVATTVAHELGHNFGMEHDDDDCFCPEDKCIMAPASSQTSPTHWSSCSLEYLKLAFEHGMDYCLRNVPTKIEGPVCGNGFLEPGEQCDCGLKKFCDNPCCNASTCMLYANASCASGRCCDLHTCQVKPIATLCRSEESECDLPEYCDGRSEFCPADVYKQDGIVCKGGRAFCFHGQCRTHTDQCKLLWGPTGQMSDKQCFDHNRKGTAIGNCGYFRMNKTYRSCTGEDTLCGMLHCTHLNERLEFGMESVAILSRSFITEGDQLLTCRSAIVDLGLNSIDPGLAPDGASCGPDKVCVNQHCLPVGSLKVSSCPQSCGTHGVCNSNGNCHCDAGFAPPLCNYPGPGGSEDSGPALDPNAVNYVAYALYVIFLAIVPMVAVSAFLFYYFREHIKTWWISKAREKAISRRTKDAYQRRNRPASTLVSEKSFRALQISSPISDTGGHVKTTPTSPDASAGGAIPPQCPLQRTQSVKAAKLNLDRNSMRNLEISNPIPQPHASVSASAARAVPIRPAPPPPQGRPLALAASFNAGDCARPPSWATGSAAPLHRTGSMKDGGSVRLKRLSSGASFRPTNPPPRPPPLRQETSPTEDIYESVIYSEPSFDKAKLRFIQSDDTAPSWDTSAKVPSVSAKEAPGSARMYSELGKSLSGTKTQTGATKTQPSACGAQTQPGSFGSKSQPGSFGAKSQSGPFGAKGQPASGTKTQLSTTTASAKMQPSTSVTGTKAQSVTTRTPSSVGALARRFETQLGPESNVTVAPKVQCKDSFKAGGSFRSAPKASPAFGSVVPRLT